MKKGFAAALVGTMLVAFSIGEWRHQAVLFEAIDRGIFLYASKDGVSASLSIVDDLFVPWSASKTCATSAGASRGL